jgi:hypothetical protein
MLKFRCSIPKGKGWRRVPDEHARSFHRAARRVAEAYCVNRVKVCAADRQTAEEMDFRVVLVRFAGVDT